MAMKNLERGIIVWSPLTKEQLEAYKLFEEGIKLFDNIYNYDIYKTSNVQISGRENKIPITKYFFGNYRVIYIGEDYGKSIVYNFMRYDDHSHSINYIRTKDSLYHEIQLLYNPIKPIYDPRINDFSFFDVKFFRGGNKSKAKPIAKPITKPKAKPKAKPNAKPKAKPKAKLIKK
jgi:hypothetical protein